MPERTYRPLLCLVQVATAERAALIDALSIKEMGPFWEALAQPGHETIVHAGRGEVEFCLRAVGRPPGGLFDVQIAAGMVGMEYPASLGTLISRLVGGVPGAGETRTDWRRRPLTERQVRYALEDVRHLRTIRDVLDTRLRQLGRRGWLTEEMAVWQEEVEGSLSQERWRRVSGNTGLDRPSLAIVRELWRWREAEAERRDCPPRRILRDDLIIELAKRKTAEVKRIQAVRGLNRGDLKRLLPKIAACVGRALALSEDQWPGKPPSQKMPQLPVLGQFLFSALGSVCRQRELAPALVGTPSDVRELVAYRTGRPNSGQVPRLARGWRAQIAGQMFDDLLAGKLSIRIADPTSEHPLVIEPTDR